jgi:hypothetical protein
MSTVKAELGSVTERDEFIIGEALGNGVDRA